MRRWILLFVILVVPFVAGFAFVQSLPDVDILQTHFPRVSYHEREDGSVHVETRFERSRPPSWTDLSSIPGWVQGAVITSEDWAFFQHDGFDFNQIREAVEEKVDGNGKLRGASTLSQQLVKNLFLGQERSWSRKISEAWLTHRLESEFKKKKILEFYLNVVEWGRGVVGIRQAARHYFGKTPSALDPREAAYLAYLLPSPRRYSRGFRQGQLSAFAHRQIMRNLERMKQAAYITDVQYEYFSRERLAFEGTQFDESLEAEVPGEETTDTDADLGRPSFAPSSDPLVNEAGSEDSLEPPVLIAPETIEEEAPLDVSSPSSL